MTLPDTMRAVEISAPGAPEVLVETTRPVPMPGHTITLFPAPPSAATHNGTSSPGHTIVSFAAVITNGAWSNTTAARVVSATFPHSSVTVTV